MHSFLSKVFGRKEKDSETSPTTLRPGELLDGKFEAISPNVSPSAANFLELDSQTDGENGKDKDKDKDKDARFSLFRAKSRPSPPEVTYKTPVPLPQLSLDFAATNGESSTRTLESFLSVDPDAQILLSDTIIGRRRLNPLEALVLIRACSQAIVARGLETLGVMHPHWYSASPEIQRRLLSQFIHSMEPKTPLTAISLTPALASSPFESEINFTRSPHDVAAVLRWGLRHLQLEGDNFGTDDGWYKAFLDAEAAAEYPPKAFSEKLAPALPPAHLELLTATLEIFSSLAAHSEANSTSGSKLSKIFGLWLLTSRRVEDKDDWKSFYARWERTGRMLEHLFLSRIRDESTDHRMPVRLLELVRRYPYTQGLSSPTTDLQFLSPPHFTTRCYDALYVRIEVELSSERRKPKLKVHPLNILADAFSTKVEGGEYAELWAKITAASKTGSNPSPLSNIFADETIRFLSIVPDKGSSKAQEAKSPVFSLLSPSSARGHSASVGESDRPTPSSARGHSFSVGEQSRLSPAQHQHSKSATEPPPLSATSPIGSDWVQFSSSGFLDSTPAIAPLVSTLFDTDLEKTTPVTTTLSRKSSKRGKAVSRKSVDFAAEPAPPISPPPVDPVKKEATAIVRATKLEVIALDEAFIDFWSDSLLDPITATWPTFIICKFKSTLVPQLRYGPIEEGQKQKTLKWLVLEQAFTVRPAPPPSPTLVPLPESARPVSPALSTSGRNRFSFWSMSRTASSSSQTSQKGKKKEKVANVGEMGELVEEETAEHVKEDVVKLKSIPSKSRKSKTEKSAEPVPEPAGKEIAKAPVAEAQAPVADVQVPVVEPRAPVAETKSPAAEAQASIAEAPSVVAEAEVPVAEPQDAGNEVKAPIAEVPFAEAQAPVAEAGVSASEAKAPAIEAPLPVVEAEPPVVAAQAPVVETVSPVAEVQPPIAEGPVLVAEAQAPVAEVSSLAAEVQVPNAEVQEPVVEVQAHATEAQAPVNEIPPPTAEVPAPVIEVPSSATEVPAPVVEISAPTAEISAPVVEVPAPIAEVDSPVVEASSSAAEVQAPTPAADVQPGVLDVQAPAADTQAPVVEVPLSAVQVPSPASEIQIAEIQTPVADEVAPVNTAEVQDVEILSGTPCPTKEIQPPTVTEEEPESQISTLEAAIAEAQSAPIVERAITPLVESEGVEEVSEAKSVEPDSSVAVDDHSIVTQIPKVPEAEHSSADAESTPAPADELNAEDEEILDNLSSEILEESSLEVVVSEPIEDDDTARPDEVEENFLSTEESGVPSAVPAAVVEVDSPAVEDPSIVDVEQNDDQERVPSDGALLEDVVGAEDEEKQESISDIDFAEGVQSNAEVQPVDEVNHVVDAVLRTETSEVAPTVSEAQTSDVIVEAPPASSDVADIMEEAASEDIDDSVTSASLVEAAAEDIHEAKIPIVIPASPEHAPAILEDSPEELVSTEELAGPINIVSSVPVIESLVVPEESPADALVDLPAVPLVDVETSYTAPSGLTHVTVPIEGVPSEELTTMQEANPSSDKQVPEDHFVHEAIILSGLTPAPHVALSLAESTSEDIETMPQKHATKDIDTSANKVLEGEVDESEKAPVTVEENITPDVIAAEDLSTTVANDCPGDDGRIPHDTDVAFEEAPLAVSVPEETVVEVTSSDDIDSDALLDAEVSIIDSTEANAEGVPLALVNVSAPEVAVIGGNSDVEATTEEEALVSVTEGLVEEDTLVTASPTVQEPSLAEESVPEVATAVEDPIVEVQSNTAESLPEQIVQNLEGEELHNAQDPVEKDVSRLEGSVAKDVPAELVAEESTLDGQSAVENHAQDDVSEAQEFDIHRVVGEPDAAEISAGHEPVNDSIVTDLSAANGIPSEDAIDQGTLPEAIERTVDDDATTLEGLAAKESTNVEMAQAPVETALDDEPADIAENADVQEPAAAEEPVGVLLANKSISEEQPPTADAIVEPTIVDVLSAAPIQVAVEDLGVADVATNDERLLNSPKDLAKGLTSKFEHPVDEQLSDTSTNKTDLAESISEELVAEQAPVVLEQPITESAPDPADHIDATEELSGTEVLDSAEETLVKEAKAADEVAIGNATLEEITQAEGEATKQDPSLGGTQATDNFSSTERQSDIGQSSAEEPAVEEQGIIAVGVSNPETLEEPEVDQDAAEISRTDIVNVEELVEVAASGVGQENDTGKFEGQELHTEALVEELDPANRHIREPHATYQQPTVEAPSIAEESTSVGAGEGNIAPAPAVAPDNYDIEPAPATQGEHSYVDDPVFRTSSNTHPEGIITPAEDLAQSSDNVHSDFEETPHAESSISTAEEPIPKPEPSDSILSVEESTPIMEESEKPLDKVNEIDLPTPLAQPTQASELSEDSASQASTELDAMKEELTPVAETSDLSDVQPISSADLSEEVTALETPIGPIPPAKEQTEISGHALAQENSAEPSNAELAAELLPETSEVALASTISPDLVALLDTPTGEVPAPGDAVDDITHALPKQPAAEQSLATEEDTSRNTVVESVVAQNSVSDEETVVDKDLPMPVEGPTLTDTHVAAVDDVVVTADAGETDKIAEPEIPLKPSTKLTGDEKELVDDIAERSEPENIISEDEAAVDESTATALEAPTLTDDSMVSPPTGNATVTSEGATEDLAKDTAGPVSVQKSNLELVSLPEDAITSNINTTAETEKQPTVVSPSTSLNEGALVEGVVESNDSAHLGAAEGLISESPTKAEAPTSEPTTVIDQNVASEVEQPEGPLTSPSSSVLPSDAAEESTSASANEPIDEPVPTSEKEAATTDTMAEAGEFESDFEELSAKLNDPAEKAVFSTTTSTELEILASAEELAINAAADSTTVENVDVIEEGLLGDDVPLDKSIGDHSSATEDPICKDLSEEPDVVTEASTEDPKTYQPEESIAISSPVEELTEEIEISVPAIAEEPIVDTLATAEKEEMTEGTVAEAAKSELATEELSVEVPGPASVTEEAASLEEATPVEPVILSNAEGKDTTITAAKIPESETPVSANDPAIEEVPVVATVEEAAEEVVRGDAPLEGSPGAEAVAAIQKVLEEDDVLDTIVAEELEAEFPQDPAIVSPPAKEPIMPIEEREELAPAIASEPVGDIVSTSEAVKEVEHNSGAIESELSSELSPVEPAGPASIIEEVATASSEPESQPTDEIPFVEPFILASDKPTEQVESLIQEDILDNLAGKETVVTVEPIPQNLSGEEADQPLAKDVTAEHAEDPIAPESTSSIVDEAVVKSAPTSESEVANEDATAAADETDLLPKHTPTEPVGPASDNEKDDATDIPVANSDTEPPFSAEGSSVNLSTTPAEATDEGHHVLEESTSSEKPTGAEGLAEEEPSPQATQEDMLDAAVTSEPAFEPSPEKPAAGELTTSVEESVPEVLDVAIPQPSSSSEENIVTKETVANVPDIEHQSEESTIEPIEPPSAIEQDAETAPVEPAALKTAVKESSPSTVGEPSEEVQLMSDTEEVALANSESALEPSTPSTIEETGEETKSMSDTEQTVLTVNVAPASPEHAVEASAPETTVEEFALATIEEPVRELSAAPTIEEPSQDFEPTSDAVPAALAADVVPESPEPALEFTVPATVSNEPSPSTIEESIEVSSETERPSLTADTDVAPANSEPVLELSPAIIEESTPPTTEEPVKPTFDFEQASLTAEVEPATFAPEPVIEQPAPSTVEESVKVASEIEVTLAADAVPATPDYVPGTSAPATAIEESAPSIEVSAPSTVDELIKATSDAKQVPLTSDPALEPSAPEATVELSAPSAIEEPVETVSAAEPVPTAIEEPSGEVTTSGAVLAALASDIVPASLEPAPEPSVSLNIVEESALSAVEEPVEAASGTEQVTSTADVALASSEHALEPSVPTATIEKSTPAPVEEPVKAVSDIEHVLADNDEPATTAPAIEPSAAEPTFEQSAPSTVEETTKIVSETEQVTSATDIVPATEPEPESPESFASATAIEKSTPTVEEPVKAASKTEPVALTADTAPENSELEPSTLEPSVKVPAPPTIEVPVEDISTVAEDAAPSKVPTVVDVTPAAEEMVAAEDPAFLQEDDILDAASEELDDLVSPITDGSTMDPDASFATSGPFALESVISSIGEDDEDLVLDVDSKVSEAEDDAFNGNGNGHHAKLDTEISDLLNEDEVDSPLAEAFDDAGVADETSNGHVQTHVDAEPSVIEAATSLPTVPSAESETVLAVLEAGGEQHTEKFDLSASDAPKEAHADVAETTDSKTTLPIAAED
ncbi:hypothetical protein CVT25_012802 [Psilocybe cyanescens]|uniref:Meiotically up-regulated protein Msb1/Mug8 domain-containing protein n=1 Tax=Psilocybe cyanescens TaxID=93625 RepID=A0A409XLK3_PSICY|nr:hypothetical protein CVT25_012802 [Psilocybe cyanescens]